MSVGAICSSGFHCSGSFTCDDYQNFPEDGRLYEFIGGILIVSPPPIGRQQLAAEQCLPTDKHVPIYPAANRSLHHRGPVRQAAPSEVSARYATRSADGSNAVTSAPGTAFGNASVNDPIWAPMSRTRHAFPRSSEASSCSL